MVGLFGLRFLKLAAQRAAIFNSIDLPPAPNGAAAGRNSSQITKNNLPLVSIANPRPLDGGIDYN